MAAVLVLFTASLALVVVFFRRGAAGAARNSACALTAKTLRNRGGATTRGPQNTRRTPPQPSRTLAHKNAPPPHVATHRRAARAGPHTNAAATARSGPSLAVAQRLSAPPHVATHRSRRQTPRHTTRDTPAQGDATNSPPPKAPKAKKKGTKTIEQTYQKKTQLEHILLRPDTYVGSIEQSTQPMWVLDASTKRIVKKQTTYVPGLFKIFDEIMVNAADNKQRDPSMTTIKVDIDRDTNTISVANDGKGIPVQIHGEHNCYVPELIFGHLLTGSNFDDDEKKTTGAASAYDF
jgi:hypothetical protein